MVSLHLKYTVFLGATGAAHLFKYLKQIFQLVSRKRDPRHRCNRLTAASLGLTPHLDVAITENLRTSIGGTRASREGLLTMRAVRPRFG